MLESGVWFSKNVKMILLSTQIISTDAAENGGAESVVPEEQPQLADAQQVLVALASAGAVESSAGVVEVNMFELLNNSVTFICEDKTLNPES